MPFLIAVLALIAPRIVILALYFFTTWFVGIFASLIWPILGFIFAPTSLLWFTVVHHAFGGVWTTGAIVGMVIAALIDLSPAGWRR